MLVLGRKDGDIKLRKPRPGTCAKITRSIDPKWDHPAARNRDAKERQANSLDEKKVRQPQRYSAVLRRNPRSAVSMSHDRKRLTWCLFKLDDDIRPQQRLVRPLRR